MFCVSTKQTARLKAWLFKDKNLPGKIQNLAAKFFGGLTQKSAPTIRWKCDLESIPKISCKNFEN